MAEVNAFKQQDSRIQEEIREVCRMMQLCRGRFEMTSDPDLTESIIYEMESLRARYRYWLRLAREQDIRLPKAMGL